MLASTISRSSHASGIRLLDPNRDLLQVADLIEESFAGEFGPAGLAAVRDLRMMAGLSPLLWLLTRASGEFRDAFTGFVWVEDGRVVGNISLNRSKPSSKRWHIANVAVAKAHRGKGIGRQLVEAGLELIQARYGEWAILQVRDDNPSALHIYDSLEFERLYSATELYLKGPFQGSPSSEVLEGYHIQTCRTEDWQQVRDLVIASTPAMDRWVRGFNLSDFRHTAIGRLRDLVSDAFSGTQKTRLCALYEGQIAGYVRVQSRGWGGDALVRLHVHPDHRGKIESALIRQGTAKLKIRANQEASVEHFTDHAAGIQALKDIGFEERRTLITMRRQL